MKKIALFLAAAVCVRAALFASGLKFEVSCDKADCVYSCGETALFTVTVTDETGAAARCGTVDAVLDNFGSMRLGSERRDLAATNVFTVSGTLKEPGFLRLTLSAKGAERKVWSVAFEPRRIRKGSPSPTDFDRFWAAAKAELAEKVPLDARMDEVPERSTAALGFYRVSFATFGRRVYGYLSVPKDRTRAPWPVEVEVNAAGFGSWTNDMAGRDDAVCLRMSVYPFEMDWKWKEKNLKATSYDVMNRELSKRFGTPGYSTSGIAEGRESYFFYPVILGIDRAVDWVLSRNDIDRTRVRYQGTSQGGGFGFYLCGLNKAFTRAVFYVPALTDTMGYLAGRHSGWPKIIEGNSSTPGKRAAAEKWAPYFDGANFASRITCPVRVVAGFSDVTCPPCAVYAAFNEIASADKDIFNGIGMTHSCRREFYVRGGEWARKHSGGGLQDGNPAR